MAQPSYSKACLLVRGQQGVLPSSQHSFPHTSRIMNRPLSTKVLFIWGSLLCNIICRSDCSVSYKPQPTNCTCSSSTRALSAGCSLDTKSSGSMFINCICSCECEAWQRSQGWRGSHTRFSCLDLLLRSGQLCRCRIELDQGTHTAYKVSQHTQRCCMRSRSLSQ